LFVTNLVGFSFCVIVVVMVVLVGSFGVGFA
jgi:hypothetical protein